MLMDKKYFSSIGKRNVQFWMKNNFFENIIHKHEQNLQADSNSGSAFQKPNTLTTDELRYYAIQSNDKNCSDIHTFKSPSCDVVS